MEALLYPYLSRVGLFRQVILLGKLKVTCKPLLDMDLGDEKVTAQVKRTDGCCLND